MYKHHKLHFYFFFSKSLYKSIHWSLKNNEPKNFWLIYQQEGIYFTHITKKINYYHNRSRHLKVIFIPSLLYVFYYWQNPKVLHLHINTTTTTPCALNKKTLFFFESFANNNKNQSWCAHLPKQWSFFIKKTKCCRKRYTLLKTLHYYYYYYLQLASTYYPFYKMIERGSAHLIVYYYYHHKYIRTQTYYTHTL